MGPASLVKVARAASGMSQRQLALKARTAQSVVARVELDEASPTWTTLTRLLKAAGYHLSAELQPIPVFDRQELDDIPRILALSPEDRLREVALVSRFVTGAHRV